PSLCPPLHRRRRCPCAGGRAGRGLPSLAGTLRAAAPCDLAGGGRPLRASRWCSPLVGAPRVAAPCGLAAAGHARGWLLPLRVAAPCGLLPPRATAPLQGGLGCCRPPPCRWPGHALLSLLVAFAVKTQQERVERFYVIQYHHMQFKINLSHENLGSDTIVGKPQWVHRMRSGNQNKN
ncbi:hypothetical protein GW17_00053991, partial [Ensete ventricosum]